MRIAIAAQRFCVQARQIMRTRESILRDLEAEARSIVESGVLESWHADTPATIRNVAQGVNGPLLKRLAERINWSDAAAIDFFRKVLPRYAFTRSAFWPCEHIRARHSPANWHARASGP